MNQVISLFSRYDQEQFEKDTLAPYAICSSETAGRIYPEEEHPFRTCFQRDRDRVIHSEAFRRLEYKTQVFIMGSGDHYRTRLTHTLEVAQIARTMGRILRVNQDLVEVHALAHDLGHPPFGHAGERELQELMKDDGGFEHNAQALRIVDKLEKRYPNFPGLNLTAETRRSLLKTKSPYKQDIQNIIDDLPIEAQLVDIADEISYCSHDLDDGLQSGLLDEDAVFSVPIWQEAREMVREQYPKIDFKRERYQILIQVINNQVIDVVNETFQRLQKRDHASGEIIVDYSPAMRNKVKEAKAFLFIHLYRHPKVMQMIEKSSKLIPRLFINFLEKPTSLPDGFQSNIKTEGLKRTVCDYISGMTDRFFEHEYNKHIG